MAKHYFDIEERLVKRVCVDAPSEEAAADIVAEMYHTQAIVLDSYEDFEDYCICAVDNPGDREVKASIAVKNFEQ